MKRFYPKPSNFSYFVFFVVLLITALIIHSCKKDPRSSESVSLSQSELSLLQLIYKIATTTDKNNLKALNVKANNATTLSNTNYGANSSDFNLISNLNVQLDKYLIKNRSDNSRVVEFEMQPDSNTLVLKKLSIGDTIFYKNKTSSVFIKLNDGGRINCFMKVIEDFSKTRKSVIKNVHYQNIPKTFNGVVLFYSLNKKFINGYRYKNGTISGIINASSTVTNAQGVVTESKARMLVLADPGTDGCDTELEIDDYVCYYGGTPDDPNQFFNGCETVGSTYIYVSCYYGGGEPGTAAGDSGGGGNSSNPTTPQTPPNLLDKLTRSSTLTDAQKAALLTLLQQLQTTNCLGKALINFFTSNGTQFNWSVNPNLPSQASYTPINNSVSPVGSIALQGTDSLDPMSLFEELFHAYQDATYPGGTAQYLNSASANIELEAKLLNDLYRVDNNLGGAYAINNDAHYIDFLTDLTSTYSSYPTSFSTSQLGWYNIFLGEFIQPNYNPYYTNDVINYSFQPSAIFSLINSSPCNSL